MKLSDTSRFLDLVKRRDLALHLKQRVGACGLSVRVDGLLLSEWETIDASAANSALASRLVAYVDEQVREIDRELSIIGVYTTL